MTKDNKFCQSCGMPITKDPQGGGTNADSSKNLTYCGYCFVDGNFTWEGNVKDFQEHCRKKMIESGHPKFKAWLFTRGLKRLERWKS
jgi:hypothetical protein